MQPRIVDLFCGCGGFSLGADAAGLQPQIAFDIDPILTSSMQFNFPQTKLILADLSTLDGVAIERQAGGPIDGVFGGPPCQGFSAIGHRKADDPRRSLVGHFFRLVDELSPSFFVMENVQGLGYSDARSVLDEGLDRIAGKFEIVGPIVLDAADYGAATRRPRLFVIGYNAARCDNLTVDDLNATKVAPVTVQSAIEDLQTATMIGEVDGFDLWKIQNASEANTYSGALHSEDKTFTGHRETKHTEAVKTRFSKLEPGGIDAVGRHPRLRWDGQCPTLRAGTGSDLGSFQSVRPIHPSMPRVITVREAARLQGFPDRFRFHPTVWHSFRMIGNSVSPIISKALFSLINEKVGLETRAQIAAE